MPMTIGWRSRINVTIQVHIFFVTIPIHAGVLDVAGAEVCTWKNESPGLLLLIPVKCHTRVDFLWPANRKKIV